MKLEGVTVDQFQGQRVPRWSMLSRLGKNRILRSSYLWFFFVPIAAKATEWKLPFGGAVHQLNWSLPFSWEVFYFSAVAFATASALYDFFCPAFIQDYPTYSHFRQQGKGDQQLVEYVLPSIAVTRASTLSAVQADQILGFLAFANNTREVWALVSDDRNPAVLRRALSRIRINEDDLSDAFWYLQNIADLNRVVPRCLCSLFYCSGFGLTFVLTIQDIVSVARAG